MPFREKFKQKLSKSSESADKTSRHKYVLDKSNGGIAARLPTSTTSNTSKTASTEFHSRTFTPAGQTHSIVTKPEGNDGNLDNSAHTPTVPGQQVDIVPTAPKEIGATTTRSLERTLHEFVKASDIDGSRAGAKKGSDVGLWERAWADLESEKSNAKYVSDAFFINSSIGVKQKRSTNLNNQAAILEKNFESLANQDTLISDITNLTEIKENQGQKPGRSTASRVRRVFTRSAKSALSTKEAGMGLAKLDPYGIAPFVLGGVYTVFEVVQNNSEERDSAVALALDVAEVVALWNSIERYQISKNLNSRLDPLYDELSNAIVELYRKIIVLLGTTIAHLEKGRWGVYIFLTSGESRSY